MRCLILGQGKSGTSALFYSIVNRMPGAISIFEPVPMSREQLEPTDLVVKKLIEYLDDEEIKMLEQFDKRIYIMRDPRDAIVSRLLYIVWDRKFVYDDTKLGIFIDAIRQKERDPASISVVKLYELMDSLDQVRVLNAVQRLNRKTVDFLNKHGDRFYSFKYEDFVQGNLGDIRDYLGLDIDNEIEVAEIHQRVKRKKSAGDWKNWFTEEDVLYFKREFADIMGIDNYNDDWELNSVPVIEPEFSSEYVKRIANERREKLPLG